MVDVFSHLENGSMLFSCVNCRGESVTLSTALRTDAWDYRAGRGMGNPSVGHDSFSPVSTRINGGKKLPQKTYKYEMKRVRARYHHLSSSSFYPTQWGRVTARGATVRGEEGRPGSVITHGGWMGYIKAQYAYLTPLLCPANSPINGEPFPRTLPASPG